MRNKGLKILVSIVFAFVIFIWSRAYAASLTGNSNVNVGDTFSVTFNFGTNVAAYDNLTVSYDKDMFEYVSGDSVSEAVWWDDTAESKGIATKTYTFKAKKSGTSRITVVSNGVTSANESMDPLGTITAEKMVNVAEKVETQPEKPTVTENTQGNVKPNVATASGNNYLKYLQISEEGLSPYFSRNVTDYAIAVGEDVESIEILARAEDSNARVEISGNTGLVDGDNIITIKVTAENGYYRIYKIIATKTVDKEKSNAYLENLIVENFSLDKIFQSENLEYDIGEISSTLDYLNIVATTKDKNAKIEINGADTLVKDGKGEVVVKVIAPDGTTTKEYKINYSVKEADEDEVIQKEMTEYLKEIQDSKSKKEVALAYLKYVWAAIKKNYLLVIMYALVLFEFIHILVLRRKLKHAREDNEEWQDKKILEVKKEEESKEIQQQAVQENVKIEPPKVELLNDELAPKKEVELPKVQRSGSRADDINGGQTGEGIKLIDLDKNDGPKDELTFNIFENLNDDDIKRMLEDQIDKD